VNLRYALSSGNRQLVAEAWGLRQLTIEGFRQLTAEEIWKKNACTAPLS